MKISELMKAMFSRTDQVEAHGAHVTPQVTPQGAPQVTPQVLQLLSVLKGAKNRDTLKRALGLKAERISTSCTWLPLWKPV